MQKVFRVQNVCPEGLVIGTQICEVIQEDSVKLVSLSASGNAKEYAQISFSHFFEKAEDDCLAVYSLREYEDANEDNIPEKKFLCQEIPCSINLFFPRSGVYCLDITTR